MVVALVGLLVVAACGSSAPEAREFNLDIRNRTLEQDSPVFRVKNGDTVVFLVTSDEAGSLHLHGYDHQDELGTEDVTRMEFGANLEGRFALALHPASAGAHSHSHGEDDTGDCPEVAPLPPGAATPSVRVTAQPGPEAGEFTVNVALDNFNISLTDSDPSVAEGHWHLYVDGEILGMYVHPEVQVTGKSAGDHQVMVELANTDHCYYGISAMTVVTLAEGGEMSMDDGMDMNEDDAGSGGQDAGAAAEETIIGFLEVLPR